MPIAGTTKLRDNPFVSWTYANPPFLTALRGAFLGEVRQFPPFRLRSGQALLGSLDANAKLSNRKATLISGKSRIDGVSSRDNTRSSHFQAEPGSPLLSEEHPGKERRVGTVMAAELAAICERMAQEAYS